MPTATIAPQTASKVVEFVQSSASALEKAAATIEGHQKLASDVAAIVPQVVDTLCKQGFITEIEKAPCTAVLNNPLKCLQLLHKVAALQPNGVGRLGEPTGGKEPTVKRASAEDKPASWIAFEDKLGITV